MDMTTTNHNQTSFDMTIQVSFLFKRLNRKDSYWETDVKTFNDQRHASNWSKYMCKAHNLKEVGYYEHNI